MAGSVFLDHARRTLTLIPLAICALTSAADAQGRTRNVVLVTLDGVRTEEIFGGLDVEVLRSTIGEAGDPTDTEAYRKYWAATPEERRALLMPFFWGQLMRTQGSIAGNQALGSRVLLTNAGFESYDHPDPQVQTLSRLRFDTPTPWDTVRHDAYTFRFAMAHLRTYRPRVLYLALGDGDDWAHGERYDRYLDSLARADGYLQQLWEFLQGDEQYRDATSLVIAVDHGRGKTPVAASVARLLGFDLSEQNPQAGRPIDRLFEPR